MIADVEVTDRSCSEEQDEQGQGTVPQGDDGGRNGSSAGQQNEGRQDDAEHHDAGDAGDAGQEERQEAAAANGQKIFQQNCAACHGNRGGGSIGPALAGDETLQDTALVVNQILHGGGAMPAFADQLSDEMLAAVATHVRTSWGNAFGAVSADQVGKQR